MFARSVRIVSLKTFNCSFMKFTRHSILALLTLGVFSFLMLGNTVFAYVASSPNYRFQQDSVNMGGGLGTSTAYSSESSAGEIATGYGTSTSYGIHAGYQQALDSTSTISISVTAANISMSRSFSVTAHTATGS